MTQVHTKITSQGQISIPAQVRLALGVKPGSILEWTTENGRATVKRATRSTTVSVHEALFSEKPFQAQADTTKAQTSGAKTLGEMKLGISKLMRQKHARG